MQSTLPIYMSASIVTLGGLLLGSVAAADPARPSFEELSRMPAPQRIEYIRQQIERQSTKAIASGVLDTTPPVLTALTVASGVNAVAARAQLPISLEITDDLSGVLYAWVDASSPSGQWAGAYFSNSYPSLEVALNLGMNFTPFAESGTWKINYVSGVDAAGNYFSYDSRVLSFMGFKNTFTVANKGGSDLKPPALSSGTILTSSVSLSTPPQGTADGTPPFVGAELNIVETSPASGVQSAYMTLCRLEYDYCFGMSGYFEKYGVTGLVQVGGQLYSDIPAGRYYIDSVSIQDQAGNYTYLSSYDTDFSTIFGTKGIAVEP